MSPSLQQAAHNPCCAAHGALGMPSFGQTIQRRRRDVRFSFLSLSASLCIGSHLVPLATPPSGLLSHCIGLCFPSSWDRRVTALLLTDTEGPACCRMETREGEAETRGAGPHGF